MAEMVYSVVAVVEGKPVASWILGGSPDEAAAKASERLPEGGKLALVVPLCTAGLTQFERTKLIALLPKEQGREFLGKQVLDLIRIQQLIMKRQSENINFLLEAIKARIELIQSTQELDP